MVKSLCPHSECIIIMITLAVIFGLLLDSISCSIELEENKDSTMIESNDFCTTQSCKNAVERISKKMDPTIEPCDDFYQFACGGYLNSNDTDDDDDDEPSYEIELDLIHKLDKKIQQQMISSLEKDYSETDIEPLKIAKYLYKTCLNKSAIDEQDLTPFFDILEQIGGWPVLKENKTWNETAFNWEKTILKIGKKNYWFNQFIDLSLENNNQSSFDICISEYHPYDINDDDLINNNVENYLNYMVNIAVSMGASKKYALQELNKTLEFQIKLAKIRYPVDALIEMKPVTFSDLIKNYSYIPWEDYINHELSIKLKKDDEIILSIGEYFTNLKNLIASTPKRVVANYVLGSFIDELALDLNKTIRDIKMNYLKLREKSDYYLMRKLSKIKNTDDDDYDKKFSKIENTADDDDDDDKNQSKKCYQYLKYNMINKVLNFIYVNEYANEKTMNNVSTIFNNVQDEFIELIKNASWMDSETKNRTIEKAINVSPVFGYPKEFLNNNSYSMRNEFLENLQFVNGSYISNIINIKMYSKYTYLRTLNQKTSNLTRLQWSLCGDGTMDRYVNYHNAYPHSLFCIPAVFLQDFMYNNNLPMYINYGRIGHIFGKAVVKPHDWDHFTDWSVTFINTNPILRCFDHQYSKFNYSEFPGYEYAIFTDTPDHSGIRAAYNAYKKLSKIIDKNEKMNDKVYTPQQMFWISAASFFCIKPNEMYRPISSTWPITPPKYRIIGSFSNMKEFAQDFNCPKDSPMNPSEKCQAW